MGEIELIQYNLLTQVLHRRSTLRPCNLKLTNQTFNTHTHTQNLVLLQFSEARPKVLKTLHSKLYFVYLLDSVCF